MDSKGILIIGSGAWGTTIANVVANNVPYVVLCRARNNIKNIKHTKQYNFISKPNISYSNIKIISNPDIKNYIKNIDIIIIAIPVQFQRYYIQQLQKYIDINRHIILNLSKGIENITLQCPNQICHEILGYKIKYATLNGPSHAEEVDLKKQTLVVLSTKKRIIFNKLFNILSSKYFHFEYSNDIIGAEICSALKNAYAIAMGIYEGLSCGDNLTSVLMTKCINEMIFIGKSMNCKLKTILGLSGIGDLLCTCYTKHSRNKFVGQQISKNNDIDIIIKSLYPIIPEGIDVVKNMYILLQKKKIKANIINTLYNIIFNKSNAKSILKNI